MSEKQTNAKFSRIGMILATVGSAVGLGNIWRFPGEAATNGGGAFLLIYILCCILLGIPALMAEFTLGRAGGTDAVGTFKKFSPNKPWWIVGVIGILASVFILGFYFVVMGWATEYLWQSITGEIFRGTADVANTNDYFSNKMEGILAGRWRAFILTMVMIVVNLSVLIKGVDKGIEKLSNTLMPLLFVIMIILCITSLTLPNASAGLKYFLHPDFSCITPEVCFKALGQAFFSLSLGISILLTYAAYFPKDENLLTTSFSVAGLDFFIAFLMGIVIFPALASFGISTSAENVTGTTLVFVTLPEIFLHMPMPQLWAILFFALLVVAALTSTVSLAEVSIAYLIQQFNLTRTKACIIMFFPFAILASLCFLSIGILPQLKLFGLSLFDFFDTLTANIMLPLCALLVCIYVGWIMKREDAVAQITNNGTINHKAVKIILFLIKYICPLLIGAILIMSLTKML